MDFSLSKTLYVSHNKYLCTHRHGLTLPKTVTTDIQLFCMMYPQAARNKDKRK